ncbi:hypothetical protein RPC_3461 [Rhodopseudomonas palustris BisB18]|uniref:Uncharacterized protein n=1 Tax=Rhodopseudomonas palustris (strain BisB18) TaxID=316056 RepID=Q211D5_RHOPB
MLANQHDGLETPARILQSVGFPFLRDPCGCLEGMVSTRFGFSECAHRRASYGQHVRRAVLNESERACQGVFGSRHLLCKSKAGAKGSQGGQGSRQGYTDTDILSGNRSGHIVTQAMAVSINKAF